MVDEADLPAGWVVWSEDDDAVLAYRPDVFDGDEFPAPCLPTIYVTQGGRDRRPGRSRDPAPGTPWHVTLYMEPEVSRETDRYVDRERAVAAALDLADRFAAGEVDYRALYQVPRPSYLDRLDECTGQGS